MFRTFIILVILTVAGGVAYLSNLSDESKAKAQLNAVRAAVIDYAAANSENFPKPQPFGELVSGDLAQYLGTNYDDLEEYSGFDLSTLRYNVYESQYGTFFEISGKCRSYTKQIIAASNIFAATTDKEKTANARYIDTGHR
jgi:hypothetical protein